MVLSDYERV